MSPLDSASVAPLAISSLGWAMLHSFRWRRVLRGEWNAKGWAESVGEREDGVASVSAPVLDARGNILAAVSVSGPIQRTTRSPGRRYGAAVVGAAGEIEAALAATS